MNTPIPLELCPIEKLAPLRSDPRKNDAAVVRMVAAIPEYGMKCRLHGLRGKAAVHALDGRTFEVVTVRCGHVLGEVVSHLYQFVPSMVEPRKAARPE